MLQREGHDVGGWRFRSYVFFVIVLVLFGIPSLTGAMVVLLNFTLYLLGDDFYRNTLYIIPPYLIVFFISVVALILSYQPIARQYRLKRPVCVSNAALLLLVAPIGLLPFTLAFLVSVTGERLQPPLLLASLLHLLPAIGTVWSFYISGGLFRLRAWARRGAIASLAFSIVLIGVIIDRWWWLTSTTMEDYRINPSNQLPWLTEHMSIAYALIAIPVFVIITYCLTRPQVRAVFERSGEKRM